MDNQGIDSLPAKKQRPGKSNFFKDPIEELAALIFPWLNCGSAGNLSLVNKAWTKRYQEQQDCDIGNKEDLPALYFVLSVFEDNGERLSVSEIEKFKFLTPQEKTIALLAASDQFCIKLLESVVVEQEGGEGGEDLAICRMLREATELLKSELVRLEGFEQTANGAKAHCSQQEKNVVAILDRIQNASIEDCYNIPYQLVNFFVEMEPFFTIHLLAQAARAGQFDWVSFFLNLEVLGLIEISPVNRGIALCHASEYDFPEIVNAILKSGLIHEGELLQHKGFRDNSESFRSVSICNAVEQNHLLVLKVILKNHPILGSDEHLESALQVSIHRSPKFTKALLQHISYRESAITAAEDAATGSETLSLLAEFRERHGFPPRVVQHLEEN